MKNRTFSWILIALSLVCWLTQVSRQYASVLSEPLEYRAYRFEEFWPDVLWQILPYAIILAVVMFVSLPKLAHVFLFGGFLYIGVLGIGELSGFIGSGSCMRGLGFLFDLVAQVIVAVAAVLLALAVKLIVFLRRNYKQPTTLPVQHTLS